jgi:hypothetical protein
LAALEASWLEWESARRETILDLQQRLVTKDLEFEQALANAEAKHKRELSEVKEAASIKANRIVAVESGGPAEGDVIAEESAEVNEIDGCSRAELEELRSELEAKARECEVRKEPDD